MDDFKKYATAALKFGIRSFEITPIVGDPLLDPLLIDRLRFLFDNGAERVVSFTNLLGLTEDILKKLDQFPDFRLNISIYGIDEKTYEDRTGCKSFQKFFDNLRMLVNHMLDGRKFMIGEANFRTKITKLTPIELMIDGLRAYGSVEASYQFDQDFNWHELLKVENTLEDPPTKREVSGVCRNLLDDVSIWPNGDVGICAGWFDINKQMLLGNLNEMTMDEIFDDGSKYSSIIKEQQEGKYRSLCAKCSYLTEDPNPFEELT
jgi:radical SAM protein with 4Fe4S-binding SPASM domain